jgi:hypothetical protein
MSTQTGLIRLRGAMDGLTFYNAFGRDLVRKTSGPAKRQIMYGKNFVRTRENISEFGGCSRISKAFRTSLAQAKHLTDGQFGNRLTKLFKLVNMEHDGPRGQRAIELSKHKDMFTNFECNLDNKLSAVFPGPFTFSHDEQRTSAVITVPAGQAYATKGPEGATHFRIVHAMGLVCDYGYNPKLKGYGPVEQDHVSGGVMEYSAYLSLEEVTASEVTVALSLKTSGPIPNNISVVQAAGICFYQALGSVYYPLKQGHALKILAVF